MPTPNKVSLRTGFVNRLSTNIEKMWQYSYYSLWNSVIVQSMLCPQRYKNIFSVLATVLLHGTSEKKFSRHSTSTGRNNIFVSDYSTTMVLGIWKKFNHTRPSPKKNSGYNANIVGTKDLKKTLSTNIYIFVSGTVLLGCIVLRNYCSVLC